jgi:superoxide dismutase, Cu-Zn family
VTHVRDRWQAKRAKLCKNFPAHARNLISGDALRRITKAALGGVAGCALVLGGTQVASGALTNILKIQGFAEDLSTTTEGALDSARAKIVIAEDKTTDTPRTTFTVRITGIDPKFEGTKLGGHLHTGPCVEDAPTQAGPHYNDEVVKDGKVAPTMQNPFPLNPAEVSSNTEVWFEFVANADGMAYDSTTVNFIPDDSVPDPNPGDMSVVVHALPTQTEYGNPTALQPAGYAGARWACFPVSVPQWGIDQAS